MSGWLGRRSARPDLPALLLITLLLAAPAAEGPVKDGATAERGEREVPVSAMPTSGAPGPVREASEVSFGAFAPTVAAPDDEEDDLSFDTVAAIPEPRVPRVPAQNKRMLMGSRKRSRNPNHRFLPLPHLSSQPAVGVVLGGSLTYSYRRRGEVFNRIWMLAWSRISTKLVQDHILQGRVRDMLGRREVFQFGAIASTDPVHPFFGINNHENLSGTDLNARENQFNANNYGGWLTYEHPIWQLERIGRADGVLRVFSGVLFNTDVMHPYEDTRLQRELPDLPRVVRRSVLRGGLTWDSRDNDWSPREGNLTDVTFDAAGKYTGSTENWGRMHATTRHYWRLGASDLVLAHRLTLDVLWGNAPLIAMGEFGGLFPMDGYGGAYIGRGFTKKRFIGKVKATAGAELRYMPVELKFGRHTIGVGWEGFLELGFISMRLADMFKSWSPSGGNGLLLIWDRFVVLRVEVAGSREGAEIYVQSDHAF